MLIRLRIASFLSMLNVLPIVIFSVALVLLVGCQPDYVKPGVMVEIQGEIYLDGAPVGNATVLFVPENAEPWKEFAISCGITNTQGEFELKTRDNKVGALVGKHRVYVSRTETEGTNKDFGADLLESADTAAELKNVNEQWNIVAESTATAAGEKIPFYYNLHSDLMFDVIPGRGIQRIRFDLSSVDPMLTRQKE